jgi:predicted RNA-binding Zn-ribbon protein involved in translation (DUF1610 family)
MKFKRLTKSWLIDVLLITVLAVGLYAALNLEAVQQQWLEPLKQMFAEDFDVWFQNLLAWMHDTATGITLRLILIIGGALGVIFLMAWRLLWRLRESTRYTGTDCPRCGYPMSRIRRTDLQRKISKVIPIRRFYCKKCKWKGIRLKGNHPAPLDVQQSSVKPKAPDKIDIG